MDLEELKIYGLAMKMLNSYIKTIGVSEPEELYGKEPSSNAIAIDH
jgi:hypothetical protein